MFADEYFANRANCEVWFCCTDKEVFWNWAFHLIDLFFCFYENDVPVLYSQENAPSWVLEAVAEQALHLLNLGKDPTQIDQKLTLGISSAEGNSFDHRFQADVIAPLAKKILLKYGALFEPDGFDNDCVLTGAVLR